MSMTPSNWERFVGELRVSDTNSAVRAAETIGDLADESHAPDLYRLLGDDDPFVRESAARSLTRIEGVRALSALFRALRRGEDEGYDNDSLAGYISDLLEERGREAGPLLLGMLGSPDRRDREHAAWALGFLPGDIALVPLLGALRDASPEVRAAVAGSLPSFAGDEVLAALVGLLGDVDERVRLSAVDSLGYLGDRRAEPALREALHDPDGRIRTFAVDALERLR